MLLTPESSDTSTPLLFPTGRGVDVLVALGPLVDRGDVKAGLVGEGSRAHIGLPGEGPQVGHSLMYRETSVSLTRRSRPMEARPIFSFRAGMMEHRLALPQRSP